MERDLGPLYWLQREIEATLERYVHDLDGVDPQDIHEAARRAAERFTGTNV